MTNITLITRHLLSLRGMGKTIQSDVVELMTKAEREGPPVLLGDGQRLSVVG
jgi:hypothetical protein